MPNHQFFIEQFIIFHNALFRFSQKYLTTNKFEIKKKRMDDFIHFLAIDTFNVYLTK